MTDTKTKPTTASTPSQPSAKTNGHASSGKAITVSRPVQPTQAAAKPAPAPTPPPKAPPAKPERPAAHTVKIERAQASLQPLTQASKAIFDSAKGLTSGELNILAAWITLESRRKSTGVAPVTDFGMGDTVLMKNAQHQKHVNKTGVIVELRKIRCFVAVEGDREKAYALLADCELVRRAGAKSVELATEPEGKPVELAAEADAGAVAS